MRKITLILLLLILFCPFAIGTEYKLTIQYTDFVSSYDNLEHETTTQAICTSDDSKKFDVTWVSYNVMVNTNMNICFKYGGGKNGARVYNKTNLGKIIKISYGVKEGNILLSYGDEENPYNYNSTIGTDDVWGFFCVRNDNSSKEAKLSTYTITITFEIDDTPPTIILDESSMNNNSIISNNLNKTVNVNLYRSLTEGMWNSICLPFNMNSDQKTSLFGEGYSLQQFSNIANDNGVTQLCFSSVQASEDLEAGKPYIVYPTRSTSTSVAEVISGVTMSNTATPGTVTINDDNNNPYIFQGIYIPSVLERGNKNIIFIGTNNKLYWPNSNNPMKAFRAYFTLPSSTTSSNFSLSTEEQGVVNNISMTEVSCLNHQCSTGSIYTIHGQLVGTSTDLLPKGIYVTNGHKFVIK